MKTLIKWTIFFIVPILLGIGLLFGPVMCAKTKPIQYELSEDGKYYIVAGYNAAAKHKKLEIVSEYKDLPVRTIGAGAFEDCSTLESIEIPNSIQSIGNAAFGNCGKLKNIQIPISVTEIGGYVFENCNSLESLVIPDSVRTMGEYVFLECDSLKKVIIGNGLQTMGKYCFSNCQELKEVVVGDSVQSIPSYTFEGCDALEKLVIGKSVVTVEQSVFGYGGNADSLKTIIYKGDVIGWCAIDWTGQRGSNYLAFYKAQRDLYINETLVTDLIIPEGVEVINPFAFCGIASLKRVMIPASVTKIGRMAFENCESLISVHYAGTIEKWANIEFDYESANPLENEVDLYVNNNLVTELVISGSTMQIGDRAFKGCTSIESVYIGDSVTHIGYNAFSGCTSLTRVVIGEAVTSIDAYSFSACPSLTSVTFKKTSGWRRYHYSDSRGEVIASGDLANSSTAARYLTDTYISGDWKRS